MEKPNVNIDWDYQPTDKIADKTKADFEILAYAYRDGNNVIQFTWFGSAADKVVIKKLGQTGE